MTTKLYPHQQALLDSARALGLTSTPAFGISGPEFDVVTGPSIADLQSQGYLHTEQRIGRILRGNPPRSISDDDLCATCANRVDQPDSDLSRCRVGWPTIVNADDYITECAQHQKPTPGPTPGYRCTHGLGYKCATCYAQPGEVPYL